MIRIYKLILTSNYLFQPSFNIMYPLIILFPQILSYFYFFKLNKLLQNWNIYLNDICMVSSVNYDWPYALQTGLFDSSFQSNTSQHVNYKV